MFIRLATKIFIINLLLLFLCANLPAQLSYSFERINTENGLPTNAIKGLQFDHKNRFLWVATESGILRYNGHNFQTFGDDKISSKLNSRIINLQKKIDGSIFGTLEDFTIFNINKNKVDYGKYNKSIKWTDQMFSYTYNLQVFDKTRKPTPLSFPLVKLGNQCFQISENQLISFSYNRKTTLLDNLYNCKIFSLNSKLFLINNNLNVKQVDFINSDSTKVILKSMGNIAYHSQLDNFNIFQDLTNEPVYAYFNHQISEIKLESNKLICQKVVNNIPTNDYIKFFQFDKSTNTAFLGTENRGLIIAHPQYFFRKQPINLNISKSATSYAQVELSNGNIQVNTGEIYGTDSKSSLKYFDVISEPQTFITKDSSLLYTNYLGLIRYDIKSKKRKILTPDLFFNKSVFFQKGDSIYLISNYGVGILNKSDSIKKIFVNKKKSDTYFVYDVSNYDQNRLLVATSEGLYLFNIHSNSFKLFFKDQLGSHFRTIFKWNNYFFIGTYGSGIYVINNGVIKSLSLDKNNYLKYTHCFIPKLNDVWISTNKGIFKSNINNLISNFRNSDFVPNYKYYGKQEGIDILEMNGGCTPCAIKLSNGFISVPGIDGLIQFNPSIFPKKIINPYIYFDKYFLDDKQINENLFYKKLIYHNVQSIKLILGVSGMISEENIEIEYDIDGKNNWRKIPVKSPLLTIENPQPGYHTVLIRWKNTDLLVWNTRSLSFSVDYPWYSHPYIYFIYFLLLIFLIFLYVKVKTHIYKRRQKELEKEVSSKTKNLQSLNRYLSQRNQAKDHVIAIMNHDILTPLKYLHITASNLEINLKEIEAAKPISQIKATAKELEYLTSNLLNWVKFDSINKLDKKSPVDLYLLIESIIEFVMPFKQSVNVEIINNIPSGTIINGWYDPLRVLFYNLIMNSIKSTQKGKIIIYSKNLGNKISISISDEGSGMNQEMVNFLLTGIKTNNQFISNQYKKGNGVGYQIIRNLIKLISAELNISSIINAGTVVDVVIKQ